MKQVLVPVAQGFEEIELVTIADVLRRGGLGVTLAALEEGPVRGSHDIVVLPDTTLDRTRGDAYDALILPGGGPGSKRLREDERVLALARGFVAEGKLTAALCAAPTVLEAAGVLGGRRATQHLLKLGRRRILFLGGSDPEAMQRYRGYVEALSEAGVAIDDALIGRVEFEAESAEATVDTLLRRRISFDGVVATSDLMALGAIRGLHRAGVEVPRDVSVVGYDNNLLSRLSTPTLSTVQQDIPKAGRVLVSRLLEWTGDPRPEMLSTELIIRESCGA